MIYLVLIDHQHIHIAACEDEQHAAPYRARGYIEVTAEVYSAAWAARDRQERAVGEPLKDAKKTRAMRLLSTLESGKKLYVERVTEPGACRNCRRAASGLYRYAVAEPEEDPVAIEGEYCSLSCRRAVNNGLIGYE